MNQFGHSKSQPNRELSQEPADTQVWREFKPLSAHCFGFSWFLLALAVGFRINQDDIGGYFSPDGAPQWCYVSGRRVKRQLLGQTSHQAAKISKTDTSQDLQPHMLVWKCEFCLQRVTFPYLRHPLFTKMKESKGRRLDVQRERGLK